MNCPLYVDFTRTCMDKIKNIPLNTIAYCINDKYKKCPFYLILNSNENVCHNVKKCAAFENFKFYDFNKFVKISSNFCTSKNHIKCKRFILKKQGKKIPIELHPDGHNVDEWKEKTKQDT